MLDTDLADRLTDTQILLPAAIVLLLLGLAVAVQRPVSQEIARYPMEAQVPDTGVDEIALGISADTTSIDFGELPAGAMSAEKSINITNNADTRITASTRTTGNISAYVQVTPATISLPSGETRTVTAHMETTNVTATGYYSGALVVEQTQPFWRWLWNR